MITRFITSLITNMLLEITVKTLSKQLPIHKMLRNSEMYIYSTECVPLLPWRRSWRLLYDPFLEWGPVKDRSTALVCSRYRIVMLCSRARYWRLWWQRLWSVPLSMHQLDVPSWSVWHCRTLRTCHIKRRVPTINKLVLQHATPKKQVKKL